MSNQKSLVIDLRSLAEFPDNPEKYLLPRKGRDYSGYSGVVEIGVSNISTWLIDWEQRGVGLYLEDWLMENSQWKQEFSKLPELGSLADIDVWWFKNQADIGLNLPGGKIGPLRDTVSESNFEMSMLSINLFSRGYRDFWIYDPKVPGAGCGLPAFKWSQQEVDDPHIHSRWEAGTLIVSLWADWKKPTNGPKPDDASKMVASMMDAGKFFEISSPPYKVEGGKVELHCNHLPPYLLPGLMKLLLASKPKEVSFWVEGWRKFVPLFG